MWPSVPTGITDDSSLLKHCKGKQQKLFRINMLGVMVNFKRKDTVLAIYVCFLNLYFSQIQVNKILYNTVLISDGNCHKSMYNISTSNASSCHQLGWLLGSVWFCFSVLLSLLGNSTLWSSVIDSGACNQYTVVLGQDACVLLVIPG